MSDACLESSRQLIRDFKELAFLKNQNNVEKFVQNTQARVAESMQRHLARANISHGMIIANKMVKKSQTGSYWVMNILDSADNFMHHLPFFGISLALLNNLEIEEDFDFMPIIRNLTSANLLENNKIEISCGMFYMPMNDENFWAQANYGTFLNDRKLFVVKNTNKIMPNLIAGQEKGCNRNFGSSILHMAYFAANRLDGAISKIDDLATFCVGKILIDEARGFAKVENDLMITANGFFPDAPQL